MTQTMADVIGAAAGWLGAATFLSDVPRQERSAAALEAVKLGYLDHDSDEYYATPEGVQAVYDAMARGEVKR